MTDAQWEALDRYLRWAIRAATLGAAVWFGGGVWRALS